MNQRTKINTVSELKFKKVYKTKLCNGNRIKKVILYENYFNIYDLWV